jgi:hypothetical protein
MAKTTKFLTKMTGRRDLTAAAANAPWCHERDVALTQTVVAAGFSK